MARRPIVDQFACTGCGTCVEIAGNTFMLNVDELAQVIDPAGNSESEIQEAIDTCPVEAISWEG